SHLSAGFNYDYVIYYRLVLIFLLCVFCIFFFFFFFFFQAEDGIRDKLVTGVQTCALPISTVAEGGGIWGHSGVASDGTNMFVITGNTFTNQGDPWSGGEAIVRLQAGPVFTGNPTDFWAPANWHELDVGDSDRGG